MSKKCEVCRKEIENEWRRIYSTTCTTCGLPLCRGCGRVWRDTREYSKFWDTDGRPDDGELCKECKD